MTHLSKQLTGTLFKITVLARYSFFALATASLYFHDMDVNHLYNFVEESVDLTVNQKRSEVVSLKKIKDYHSSQVINM